MSVTHSILIFRRRNIWRVLEDGILGAPHSTFDGALSYSRAAAAALERKGHAVVIQVDAPEYRDPIIYRSRTREPAR